jgi:hypothetical protein
MSGGIGHVLLMIQSVKNNRNLIKKRKSFKDLKKNFEKQPVSESVNDAELDDAIKIHKADIKFNDAIIELWATFYWALLWFYLHFTFYAFNISCNLLKNIVIGVIEYKKNIFDILLTTTINERTQLNQAGIPT